MNSGQGVISSHFQNKQLDPKTKMTSTTVDTIVNIDGEENRPSYYERNRNQVRENQRLYRESNREKIRAIHKAYYLKNRAKITAYKRERWHQKKTTKESPEGPTQRLAMMRLDAILNPVENL